METYKIDEGRAMAMLEAEKLGEDPVAILDALQRDLEMEIQDER
jgi:hypothetical protein